MNAQATLAMRTQLVIIQWDLTCVHVILAILEMDLTAQVCIRINFLSCSHRFYSIFQKILTIMMKRAFHYGDISSFLLKKKHFIRFLSKHLRYQRMLNRPLRSKCNMQYATCNNTIGLWYNHISMWSWLFWRWVDLHIYTFVSISYPVILYNVYSNKEMKKKATHLICRYIFLLLWKKKKSWCLFYRYNFDIDECSSNPCHANATCNNTMGSYVYACDPGYSGDGFNCTGMHLI